MTIIPHFDYPFRFTAQSHAAVVEQDTIEEIESCLAAILLTEIGQRIELPEFGIESPLFSLQPLNTDGLYNSITDQEPRSRTIIAQRPDPLDYLAALVEVDVTAVNPIGGT